MGHSVGEEAHLGVTALLAGVTSKGIWQGDYLSQRIQDAVTRRVATQRALNPIVATG